LIRKMNISGNRPSPMRLVLIIIASIFFVELFFMLTLHEYFGLTELGEALLDASGLVLLMTPLMFIFIYRPFTAAREKTENSNRLLATIVEQTYEAVAVLGVDRVVQYVNPTFEKIFGYEGSELVGKNITIIMEDPANVAIANEGFKEAAEGRVWIGVLVTKTKDGQFYDHKLDVVPIKSKDDKVTSFSLVFKDVTQENMLLRAKRYFSSVTSHELKTPLGGLKLLQLLVAKHSDLIPADDFEKINNSAKDVYNKLEKIANSTSLYNDLTSGAQVPLGNINLGNTLREAVERTKTELISYDRRLTVVADLPSAAVGVVGNEELLGQAFEELLSNAIKYTPDGKKVFVRMTDDGKEAVVTITDEGLGIPQESLNHLFQPFFSIENIHYHSTSAYNFMGGGIGLGLTVAKIIIDHQGGKLRLSSGGYNMGTQVTISLPSLPA